jgi:hypothetical protein
MDKFLPNWVKAILLGVIVVAFGLNRLASAYPQVEWLHKFRLPVWEMSEQEKARRQKSGNRMAALQMILAGLILPFGYLASTVFMFNEPGTVAMIVVGALSFLCISVGIWLLAKNV